MTALLAWPGHCVYFPWFPWLRMCLWVCRPGPGQALPADCWRALGSSWDTRDPGPGESPIPWYLGREILCLPLIRTPWAVEVVTRETCDSIRLTLRHQGYLDFIIIGFYFYQTFGFNWLITDQYSDQFWTRTQQIANNNFWILSIFLQQELHVTLPD